MGDWSPRSSLRALDLDEVVVVIALTRRRYGPRPAARCARPPVGAVSFTLPASLLLRTPRTISIPSPAGTWIFTTRPGATTMTSKPGIPDRVNVLVDVAEGYRWAWSLPPGPS